MPLRAVTGFIEESTNPYLNIFRSFIPRIGPLDVSPIVGILVLSIVGVGGRPGPRVSSTRGRAWREVLIVCGLVVVVDQATKGAIIETMVPGERTDLALGVDLARSPTAASHSACSTRKRRAGARGYDRLAVARGRLVRVRHDQAVVLARRRVAHRRRAREPRRPDPRGRVTDFIDAPLWPAFNLADVAITAGVIVIALAALAQGAGAGRRDVTAAPRIVHRDDRLAVIDKPAGLVVHPAPGHRGPTLVDVLGDLLGGEPERPGSCIGSIGTPRG